MAIYIMGEKSPSYKQLNILAEQLIKLYENRNSPIIILMKEDFARALYQMIKTCIRTSQPVICLDHIDIGTCNYIDIGSPVGNAVPVVIKTLVYE